VKRAIVASLVAVAACSGSAAPPAQPPHREEPPPADMSQQMQASPPALPTLESLRQNDAVHGFHVDAVYLDNSNHRIGARFTHDATHFTFDYLRIESAPQAYLWVTSFPTSDKGEPHTQEHLLLGKGDRGRRLGSMEAMALAESNAFTEQWHTCYLFNTVAGHDAYWPVFQNTLDAMLYPDYTDEEIRREVRNFGVDKHSDGTLHLEEKGTVYNEMVRAYEDPQSALWRAANQLVYGASHPLALESGGYPDAIRTMTPADIRAFHDAAYNLPNMGMIGAFPSAMALDDVLKRTGDILASEAAARGAKPTPPPPMTEATLPKAQPAPAGTIQLVDAPAADATTPGSMVIAWPATRELSEVDRVTLSLFADALAGDESTPLYAKLIGGKTRVLDTGATEIHAAVSADLGHPMFVSLDGVKPDKLDRATVDKVRAVVVGELQRLAALPDGAPDLAAMADRVRSRAIARGKQLSKLLDTPPGFGFRNTGDDWMVLTHQLAQAHTFERQLTERDTLAAVDKILGEPNPWRARLTAWGLTGDAYGVAVVPSTKLRASLDAARQQRIADELARLTAKYGKDPLPKFQKDYEADTAKIDEATRNTPLPPLVDSVPLTFDDDLRYELGTIGRVKTLTASFPTMASTRVELALSLADVADADLMYLAGLPALMSGAGIVDGDDLVSAADARERLRKEVQSLDVGYDHSELTARHELTVAGAGGDVDETRRALGWMRRVLTGPDWRPENLPQLRDLVAQEIAGLRRTMQGGEEYWAPELRDAWWRQDDAVFLHANAAPTRTYDLYRLQWMLADAGDRPARAAASKRLRGLASAGQQGRARVAAIAKAMADGKDAAIGPAGKLLGRDLGALLADVPDSSLAADWSTLCDEAATDVLAGPDLALAGLARVRLAVLHGAARVVVTGAPERVSQLRGDLQQLAAIVGDAGTPATRGTARAIVSRLDGRDPSAKDPHYVGYLDAATSSGVFVNSAPAPGYLTTSDDDLRDYLASNLFTGHGAQSLYARTWAAGLAYSNGVHPQPQSTRLEYYADRVPRLAQTIGFVVELLKHAQTDPNLGQYALANAFDARTALGFEVRTADPYEVRAAAMAEDLADGVTPDVVRAFRGKLLAIAKQPGLAADLFKRMPRIYGTVLPGLDASDDKSPAARTVSFVIGPDKQLAGYQDYLHASVGKTTTLYRLYARDFWIP
jgi:hypothetical protein